MISDEDPQSEYYRFGLGRREPSAQFRNCRLRAADRNHDILVLIRGHRRAACAGRWYLSRGGVLADDFWYRGSAAGGRGRVELVTLEEVEDAVVASRNVFVLVDDAPADRVGSAARVRRHLLQSRPLDYCHYYVHRGSGDGGRANGEV